MARYIQSFSNDAAIQTAVDSKELLKPYVALNDATGKIDWDSKYIDYAGMYLTIEALEDGNFYVRKANISYSINGGNWETTTGATTLALTSGDKVRLKSVVGSMQNRKSYCLTANTISHIVYGNIESLEYGDDFIGKTASKYGLERVFNNSTGLQDVSNLVLPCTSGTLNYEQMFSGCSNITKSPVLPAPTMSSYQSMFSGCSQLSYVVCLLTNPYSLYGNLNFWLRNVANRGTLVKHPDADWSSVTGISGPPSRWTIVDYQG